MARPVGVTILGILQIVGGVFVGLLAVVVSRAPGMLANAGIPAGLAGVGAAGLTVLIVSGLLNVAVGVGLLRLFPWAWWVMMALTLLSLASSALGILAGGVAQGALGGDGLRLIVFAIDAVIVWYLLRPEIKRMFFPAAPRGPKT
jgi:hypothetical protein